MQKFTEFAVSQKQTRGGTVAVFCLVTVNEGCGDVSPSVERCARTRI